MKTLHSEAGLRCLERGKGNVIVLLHPIGMRAEFWDPVADLLASDHRVLAFDLPGFGESRRPPRAYTLDDVAREIIAALTDWSVDSAVFAGCSMGAMVAVGAALAAPELCKGVVVANSGLGFGDDGRAMIRQRAEAVRHSLADTIEGTLERWFAPAFRDANPETVGRVRTWLAGNEPEAVARGWEAIAGLDYERRLRDLQMPLLAIAGELDAAASPAGLQKIASAAPGGIFIEIGGGGHFVPLEQPQAFSRAIRQLTD
ncbi:alpha/beta fold hydrolase [Roseiarcaceae bacterium H3SJ34-1]|uniref:alpha/beta fold hydrolase n=1 Tax=Terripilifer ovatus TaxID=3032367 RepID=UPI003AB95D24|nr:alpha/beta fold hydrolase [Roseiarcaceae bacterium H3SJ34-1]